MTTSRVRCRLCSEVITFTEGNPVELEFHMIDRHSNGSVMNYSIHEDDRVCPSRRPSGGKCCATCKRDICVMDTNQPAVVRSRYFSTGGCGGSYGGGRKDSRITCPYAHGNSGMGVFFDRKNRCKRKPRGHGLYKTTLETWSAGDCYMICPECKREVKPLIKTLKNKVAFTSLGAAFLLSCWPLCFLCPPQHKCSVDLYCPICKYKLGVYDQSSGTYNTNANVVITKDFPNIKNKSRC